MRVVARVLLVAEVALGAGSVGLFVAIWFLPESAKDIWIVAPLWAAAGSTFCGAVKDRLIGNKRAKGKLSYMQFAIPIYLVAFSVWMLVRK